MGLMCLVSHYNMGVIPDDLACTSLPQQWHKPRGKIISSEPLMDMVFKKPRLDVANTTASTSAGISCSLYKAVKEPPSDVEIESFKSDLEQMNTKFGLSLLMQLGTDVAPTMSYQLALTEGNLKVFCNIDLSVGRNNNEEPITIYPLFSLYRVCSLY